MVTQRYVENKKIGTNVIIPRRSEILRHILMRSRYGAAECDIAFLSTDWLRWDIVQEKRSIRVVRRQSLLKGRARLRC